MFYLSDLRLCYKKQMEVDALGAHQLGSMAAWELQEVWLALDGQVRDTQALPPPSQMNSGPAEVKTAPRTEACLKGLCSELLVGLLQIHNK